MNFQIGRYIEYIAVENRYFAYDLGIRRNHFCWIWDVKLLLGFKFHNFLSWYVSGAKENVIGQFLLNWVDQKMAIFQTTSEFDETSFVGTVPSKHS